MTNKAMETAVADIIDLDADQRQLKRSPRGAGSRTLLDYKLGWSRTILKSMGAIQKIAPATWVVTEEGSRAVEADVVRYHAKTLDRLHERGRALAEARDTAGIAENANQPSTRGKPPMQTR